MRTASQLEVAPQGSKMQENNFLSNIFQSSPSEQDGSLKPKNIFLLVLVSIGIFSIILLVILLTFLSRFRYSTLNLTFSPLSAVATIDGTQVSSGAVHISPGTHQITIEKFGFETKTETFTLSAGQSRDFSVMLSPSEDFTKSWYSFHPEDGKISEQIGDKSADDFTASLEKTYPFASKLPIKTANFQISRSSCNGEVCFTISASSEHLDEALNYFKSRLYSDLGSLNIVFKDYHNPFKGEG